MHSTAPLSLFYSYSHKDEDLKDRLEIHLSLLRDQGIIRDWHDRRIEAGMEWDGVISQNLNDAEIILLLVSADFIASRYCRDVEVARAIERHEMAMARVIPIILRPVDNWPSTPFGKLQALPMNGKPVTIWRNRDEAFADVARGIREAAKSLTAGPKRGSGIAGYPNRAAELRPAAPAMTEKSSGGDRGGSTAYVKFLYKSKSISCMFAFAIPALVLFISSIYVYDKLYIEKRERGPVARLDEPVEVDGGMLKSNMLSSAGEASSITGTYAKARRGRLRFILAFSESSPGARPTLSESGRRARLKLVVHSPDGKTYEQDGSSAFTVDIDAAAPGDWKWTVTALEIPFESFPFTLTVEG